MERIQFISFKNKNILYIDISHLNEDDALLIIKKGTRFLMEYKEKDLLELLDFTGTNATEKIIKELKSEETIQAIKKIKKSAVVGISGIRKILLNAINKLSGVDARAFKDNDIEKAKEYLVSD